MKVDSRAMFSVVAEREQRFTVSPRVIEKALGDGKVTISQAMQIVQIWFAREKSYSGRIRHVKKLTDEKGEFYEHTVKHHVKKGLDYEITTDLNQETFLLLKKFYKDAKIEDKIRILLIDGAHEYDDYYITVDYPADRKDECWVEFESKDGKNRVFRKPDWLEE